LCPTSLDWNDVTVQEKLKTQKIIVPGDQWPLLIFQGYQYDCGQPWKGLLRSDLLAYKHIFTSPSSVYTNVTETKACRMGNAHIHGMTEVMGPSIAYAATQILRFSLQSLSIFSHTDRVSNSEQFYHSLLELFEDPEKKGEIDKLLAWWNE
ncbi:hypothetical protein OF83DRAFT_1072108, partial [Amylostereum chailletii]